MFTMLVSWLVSRADSKGVASGAVKHHEYAYNRYLSTLLTYYHVFGCRTARGTEGGGGGGGRKQRSWTKVVVDRDDGACRKRCGCAHLRQWTLHGNISSSHRRIKYLGPNANVFRVYSSKKMSLIRQKLEDIVCSSRRSTKISISAIFSSNSTRFL